jgi:diaminohydroxyphosphoribosylaminopyrimidine deaminase/5-amino-6-(5-phosphoribosylamino)uracil reductase
MYVTLEPCCHINKKTPPCVPKVIDAGISRLVIGCLDPNPQVDGGGAALLRAAGISVEISDLEAESRQLIAPFIAGIQHKRPYVTAKWAQSSNGLVAGPGGRATRITNAASNRQVHELRARCDAIAVGTNTVLADDPLLTARGVDHHRRLQRVILSNSLKIPLDSRLVRSAREHPVIVYSSTIAVESNAWMIQQLTAAGVEVVALPTHGEDRFSLEDALANLHRRGVMNLLVEPGPTLGRFLVTRGQVDRFWVFQSSNEIVDESPAANFAAPRINFPESGRVRLDGDTLIEYLNPSSNVYFANAPSADLVRVMEGSNP